MQLYLQDLPLKHPTPDQWLPTVLADFDSFLLDHAACERKASANAMSFVVRYADRRALIEPMICLAKEELAHFHEVYRLIMRRGLQLPQNDSDWYVRNLVSYARHGRDERLLDRLLIAGLVEARSCERLRLVGEALPVGELKDFYTRLAREEAGHYKVFLRLARHYFAEDVVHTAQERLVDVEAQVMNSAPLRPVVH